MAEDDTTVIDSVKDARVAAARALTTRAGRAAAGRCLLEGESLISQALEGGARLDSVPRAERARSPELEMTLANAGVPVWSVREGALRKVTGGAKPAAWLAVADLPPEAAAEAPYGDFAVVCEGVADPGNLGTVVRTTPLADLRRDLGVAESELTASLSSLLRDGHLEPGDNEVSITPAGEQALAALWPVQERIEDELFAGFTEAERAQFRSMLGRIQANSQR